MTEEKKYVESDHDYNWMLIIAPALIALVLGFVLPLRIFGIVAGLALVALGVGFVVLLLRRGSGGDTAPGRFGGSLFLAMLGLIIVVGMVSIILFAISPIPWTR